MRVRVKGGSQASGGSATVVKSPATCTVEVKPCQKRRPSQPELQDHLVLVYQAEIQTGHDLNYAI